MYEIPVGFHFSVVVGGLEGDEAKFQEVTGINAEVTTEDLKEGGLNQFVHRLPTGIKYGNLSLKRGYFNGSEVSSWCRKAIENFSFDPKDIVVTLLNEEAKELASWSFINAYPVKWKIADFKAQENALSIETLELAYQSFRKNNTA